MLQKQNGGLASQKMFLAFLMLCAPPKNSSKMKRKSFSARLRADARTAGFVSRVKIFPLKLPQFFPARRKYHGVAKDI